MKTIQLTQGKFALVDDNLFEQLAAHKWCALRSKRTFYAVRNVRRTDGSWTLQRMHRYVFELLGIAIPDGMSIDHANGNTVDNQLSNLRLATQQEQNRNHRKRITNTSGFIGVSWDQGKWRACVRVDGRIKRLGRFTDAYSAAWVRDQYVKQHHGDFAVLNNLTDRRSKQRAA